MLRPGCAAGDQRTPPVARNLRTPAPMSLHHPALTPVGLALALMCGCALGGDPPVRTDDADLTNPLTDAGAAGDAGSDEGTDAGASSAPDAGEDMIEPDAGTIVPTTMDAGAPETPDAGCPGVEVCNGIDDNCNGSIDEGGVCPCPVVDGATGHAYMLCADELNWVDARMFCQAQGYDLAAIESASEDMLVYRQISTRGFEDTWVGLNDRDIEMTWVFNDGIPVVYEHWDSGEPNDGGGGEDCGVVMTRMGRASEWDDRSCSNTRPFVCEASP